MNNNLGSNNQFNRNYIDSSFIKKELEGKPISDAEGLRRAGLETDAIYTYGDALYAAGTRGGLFDKEWQQNLKYIASPSVKYLANNKCIGLGTNLAPESTKVKLEEVDRITNAMHVMNNNLQINKNCRFFTRLYNS